MNDLFKKIVCAMIISAVFFVGTAGAADTAFAEDTNGDSGAVAVKHTGKWDQNRREYNLRCSGERVRGENVFWPGEKILVSFSASDDIDTATAYIEGVSDSLCSLSMDADGVYNGELRDSSKNSRWKKGPEERNIIVEASCSDGSLRRFSSSIVVDGTDLFWRVYRVY